MPVSTQYTVKSGDDLTPERLDALNAQLANFSPQEILEWAIDNLPNLYQTTAFGLTGLISLDMINKISIQRQQDHIIPLIFLDTLYHFQETLDLAQRCVKTYNVPLKVFKPVDCENVTDFEAQHGQKLWEVDEDAYDYLVKVEPARRAYEELNVKSVITGRRRSQKGDRAAIPVIEVDGTGLIKLNPLAYWDLQQVRTYIKANEVPYNALVDQGYNSIGDWHSTNKPASKDDERSGRWEGKEKTECGLHKDYFKMRAAFMASKKAKQQLEEQKKQQQTANNASATVEASA
ncbi:phosphoadenosine phosphosulfate reductase [Umbelopsis sp. PMI_123]|nr:phosphoadenosine phosphosulfate reductase [Umbelopsis sp. PMI_123]